MAQRFLRLGVLGLIAIGAGSVAGCVISPQPEPPSIDPQKISLDLIPSDPDGGTIVDTAVIIGAPGAVTPAGALLTVVNLDSTVIGVERTVEADGSFRVSLPGRPGHTFRLRALSDGLWSGWVDIVAPAEDGPAEVPAHPLAGCLELTPADELAFGAVAMGDIGVGVIQVSNRCGDAARIESISLRIDGTTPTDCDEERTRCAADGGEVWNGCQGEMRACDDWCAFHAAACDAEASGLDCDAFRSVCDASELCREGTDQTCDQFCDTHGASCVGAGYDEAICNELQSFCSESCTDVVASCVTTECDARAEECRAVEHEEPQGFAVHHGAVPITVPSGSSRTVVVTFTPLRPGPAEDVLLIDVSSPEAERRAVSLSAEGL